MVCGIPAERGCLSDCQHGSGSEVGRTGLLDGQRHEFIESQIEQSVGFPLLIIDPVTMAGRLVLNLQAMPVVVAR